MSPASWVTCARLALAPVIWLLALHGAGRLVGICLILAAATDVLDGYLARRLHQESTAGARLDALADTALLVSAGTALAVLHPEIVRDESTLLLIAAVTYAGSCIAGIAAFGCVVDPRQATSKIAGGLLYLFALVTLLTGAYEPLLLTAALLALVLSSLRGAVTAARKLRTDSTTIQPSGSARRQRSHAPHALNGVGSSASAITSMAISAAPTTNEGRS